MAPVNRQRAPENMTMLERLALGIGVWVILMSVVFLMGWF